MYWTVSWFETILSAKSWLVFAVSLDGAAGALLAIVRWGVGIPGSWLLREWRSSSSPPPILVRRKSCEEG
jgi:hypothetical protein